MKFIVLLFAVLLQKQTRQQGYQRNQVWFNRLLAHFNVLDMKPLGQIFVFTIMVVFPCMLLAMLMNNLSGIVGGTIGVIIQVCVFLYVLGRDDFSQRVESYKSCWNREDYQGAFNCAQKFLKIDEQVDSQSPFQLHQSVRQAIIFAWFIRFFVFVFWFLVAGISGAFACLLTYWFYQKFNLPWLKSLLGALEWLPSRLLALSIALAGDFTKSFPEALKFATDFQSSSKSVLVGTTFKANAQNEASFDCTLAQESLNDANQLMFRCAVIWLIAVAFLTLFTGF
ncbi:MAG: regulatory signaling modulator protein AmpE [Bermanella sp.]